MTCLPDTGSSLFVLAKMSGVEIESLKKAWGEALHLKQELKAKIAASGILTGGEESDRSLVVFGSLARNEFTGQGKSDVDWRPSWSMGLRQFRTTSLPRNGASGLSPGWRREPIRRRWNWFRVPS